MKWNSASVKKIVQNFSIYFVSFEEIEKFFSDIEEDCVNWMRDTWEIVSNSPWVRTIEPVVQFCAIVCAVVLRVIIACNFDKTIMLNIDASNVTF